MKRRTFTQAGLLLAVYTFYYATTAAMVTNAYTFKSLPYDAAKDFVPGV